MLLLKACLGRERLLCLAEKGCWQIKNTGGRSTQKGKEFFAPPRAEKRVSDGGVGWPWLRVWLVGWLVGLSVLVCAFVCAFVSAFVCSFRGLFACVLSWVEIYKRKDRR